MEGYTQNKIDQRLMTIEAGNGYMKSHCAGLFLCISENFHNQELKKILNIRIEKKKKRNPKKYKKDQYRDKSI